MNPADRDQNSPPLDLEAQSRSAIAALGDLAERITPWLFDVGSWIFGGLIAFNLVLMAAILTIGPVDAAIRTSITAFACALPLNVAGIFVLRLVKDVTDIKLDDLTLEAFQNAGFPEIDAYFPAAGERALHRTKRSRAVLGYSAGIAALSLLASMTGLVAALWHMAWWIGVVFLATVVLSALLVTAIISRSLPPESEAEKTLKRQYRDHLRQVRRSSAARGRSQ